MFRWVPEETQECKDNVDECVDVTKPFCREVEITLRDILMPKQFAKSLAAGGGPCLQGEANLPLGTKVYNQEYNTGKKGGQGKKKGHFRVFFSLEQCHLRPTKHALRIEKQLKIHVLTTTW